VIVVIGGNAVQVFVSVPMSSTVDSRTTVYCSSAVCCTAHIYEYIDE